MDSNVWTLRISVYYNAAVEGEKWPLCYCVLCYSSTTAGSQLLTERVRVICILYVFLYILKPNVSFISNVN